MFTTLSQWFSKIDMIFTDMALYYIYIGVDTYDIMKEISDAPTTKIPVYAAEGGSSFLGRSLVQSEQRYQYNRGSDR